ncbi:regulatory signaling modulator protein AmpE [Aliidiomarina quisquiliarum]|uniref:regulatory signaling modulator protein AmpE n=1 Tax=Aliidiomarina quisquiliarum TaxID=2938947 RepID=UPI00208EC9B7|nr:regulatory signaling modulator protein AmpE [Aliidiomarina quisquiliarum]MCO4321483.1 regulatory signaling modulator protein AmpE [Aliidiomarina quisquiliarum]
MIVLSLFVALMLERLRVSPAGWQLDSTAQQFNDWLYQHDTFSSGRKNEVFGPLVLLIPALLLAVIMLFGVGALATFFINVAMLTLAFGCRPYRDALKRWYLATAREDKETQQEASDFIMQGNGNISLGQQLVWLNFRYYFSVVFWFVLFGAPGVLGYTILRANEHQVGQLMGWVDWLPVRIAGLAFLFVGHFTRAMHAWLASIGLVQNSQEVLLQLAVAAEDITVDEEEKSTEPQAMLGLARRATIFLLASVALASLLGWIV